LIVMYKIQDKLAALVSLVSKVSRDQLVNLVPLDSLDLPDHREMQATTAHQADRASPGLLV